MKNKSLKNNIENSSREKVTRFSIRKVSFGAASVAVSALFMALGQGSASAAETNTATEANVTNAATNNNTTAQDNKKEEVAAPVATTTAPTTPTTAEKAAEKINEKLATETNTAENKEQTTPKTQETSNTAAETTKPAEATAATTESNKPKSRKRRAVESDPAATTTDEDDPSVNAKNVEVVNPYFEANGTPTKEEKFKVINSFDLIGWKLTNPNQTKVVIANGKASSYGGYGSVVDQTHPYGIPLALYTVKNDPSSKSDKFGGVYQDIDVKPGQEIVIGQNTTSYGGFGTQNNRTKLTVSYPEKGNQEQANLIWRPLVSPYSGVFTVPKGVTKIRVRLEAGPEGISQDDSSKIEIDGQTYYVGAMVSKLSITTGAHIVAKTPTVKYNEVSPSPTATTVRATISVDLVNEGHANSANNIYSVKLPDNATYVSSEGGTSANVNNGTLSINYKSLAPGEKKTLTYTVDLPADKASSTDFNGISTWKTNTAFNGLEGTVVGGTVIGTPGAKIRNIPVKAQNVTVNMYKTDLENKVNELETKLAQLNESDYTPESWKAMKDQLATAKQILNEEQDNVPVADRKNQAEINAKLVLLEKEKAKLDLEKAAKDQLAAIDAVDGSVKEEKEAAKAKVIEALAAAKKAVDATTTEADVAAKLTEETNKITPILPAEEVKTAAKNDIQSILEEKKTQIAGRDDLTTEEKDAAVKEAERLAQEAKNRVDAATTEESVERNKDRGEEKVEKVDPAAKAKPAAKAAVDAALAEKEKAIEANNKLSDAEKAAAKEEAKKAADEAKKAIEAATDQTGVDAKATEGKAAIAAVNPVGKDKAKEEVEGELAKKLAELENSTDLTDAEKATAKTRVLDEAKKAIEAIEKAMTQAEVDQVIRNFVYRISAVVLEKEEYDLSKLFVNGSVIVKQGEALADKDILSKLNLPEGVEVVKVEKPETVALGKGTAKVTLKLADGTQVTITVPVTVVEGTTAETSTNSSEEETTVNTSDVAKSDATEKSSNNVSKKQLPNTGTTETNTGLAGLGLAMLTGLFAVARRRKNDKN